MKQYYGYSKRGDVAEATAGFSKPKALIYFADGKCFERATAELASAFSGVPSIGCVGLFYCGEDTHEDGLLVIGYEDVEAVGGVIPDVGEMPLASIEDFQAKVQQIRPGNENTVCVDLTTGNDAELVTTMNIALLPKKISLVGGTAWEDTVAYAGSVYHDASVYLLLRNTTGKIRAYKENLYGACPNSGQYVATKVDTKLCALYELDGKPAETVYRDVLGFTGKIPEDISIEHPLGRVIGNEVYLLSLKEQTGNGGFFCYKKVNNLDIITMMELQDMDAIIEETLLNIQKDFPKSNGFFSINCLFRHNLFEKKNYEKTYLKDMEKLGSHAGLIGLGEHFNTQHVNQTMTGFAFD